MIKFSICLKDKMEKMLKSDRNSFCKSMEELLTRLMLFRSVEQKLSYFLIHELIKNPLKVPVSSSSLNTNDCFVLVSDADVLVWLGRGSTGDEKEMAKIIARKIAKERKGSKKVEDE